MTAEEVWAGSITGRAMAAGSRRAGRVFAASVTGRAVLRVWSVLVRWAGGSLLVSLASATARPLAAAGPSVTGRVASAVYRWLLRILGDAGPGRVARRVGAGAAGSLLGKGAWMRPLGAALAAFAIVRLVASPPASQAADGLPLPALAVAASWAGAVVLAAAGVVGLLLGSGPAVVDRRGSWAARVRTALAVAGAGAAGVFAGLTPGAGAVLPLVIIVGVVAAVCLLYRPEVLLLALAAFPWLDWGARRALGGTGLGGLWDEAFLAGAFIALLFAVFLTRRADLWVTPLLPPLALAAVAAVGSVVVMDVPTEVGVFALRVTFQPLLFYFLAQLLPRDRRWVRAAVAVFLAASLLMALHGLFQYATHAPMPAKWVDARETAISTRAYSIVENPNGLGAFLLLGSMLAAALALARIGWRSRVAAAGVALVLAAGVAVTFSRGAWLGFVVGAVALAALSHRRLLAGLVAAGLALPLVAPGAFLDRLTFAFSTEYLAKSAAAGRLLAWRTAAQRVVDHPWFGVGLGTFGGTSSFLYGYSKMWVDDFYLQLAAEGGIVLLAAFAWLLLRAAKGVVAAHGRETDPFLRAVAAGVFGGCAAVAFANLTASVWETLVVGAGFWFLAGLAAAPRPSDAVVPPAAADAVVVGDATAGCDPSASVRADT